LQPDKNPQKNNPSTFAIIAEYSVLGIQMAAFIGGMAFFGRWIDTEMGNPKRWITLVFVLVAIVATMYYVLKKINR